MTAATAGDVVAVLPGVYTENVTLKQFVRLLSAAASSTDTHGLHHQHGRPALHGHPRPGRQRGTVDRHRRRATNLQSFTGLETEIAGFTIASPLVGDPAAGIINPTVDRDLVTNSNILIDKDYIADAGHRHRRDHLRQREPMTPQIEDDVIVGNINGVVIDDGGATPVGHGARPDHQQRLRFNTIGLS